MKMFYELPITNPSDEDIIKKERIRQMVELERYCCDYGYKQKLMELWFEDGEIFTTWFKGNVMEYFYASPVECKPGEVKNPMESHRHRIHNTVVWVNGSRAIAEVLCMLDFRVELGGEWVDLRCMGRMHYRVEKRGERWGIVYLEGIYEKDRIDPVFSESHFGIPKEKLMKYRYNNWNMAARRDLYEGGLKYADEWAGPDKPETIEKLYRSSSQWLFQERHPAAAVKA